MSLPISYSSDEEDIGLTAKDAFGLASLPTAKKARLDDPSVPLTADAAPHVLAEVWYTFPFFFTACSSKLGPTKHDFLSHASK